MVFWFQNLRNLVSCQRIFAPNHAQVQLSVGLLNVWLGSDYIQLVIHKTINSWYYTVFLWWLRICATFKPELKNWRFIFTSQYRANYTYGSKNQQRDRPKSRIFRIFQNRVLTKTKKFPIDKHLEDDNINTLRRVF